MDDGGGSRITYPAPGVTFGFPTWSPDGTRIAAVGTDADGGAIYVYDVPNAGAVRLDGGPNVGQDEGPPPTVIYQSADVPPFYLFWTPDGKRIAFLASESIGLSLRVAPADGSAPLAGGAPGSIVRTGSPLYFDWLDSRRLLVHVGVGRGAFTGAVGGRWRGGRGTLKGSGDFRSPSHSADGRYVAFVRSTGTGSGQLVVARPDGSGSHEMPVVGPAAFAFDPAGDTLATLGSDTSVDPGQPFPTGPIRLINPATGAMRTLVGPPGGRVLLVTRRADDRGDPAEPARRQPDHRWDRQRLRHGARRRSRARPLIIRLATPAPRHDRASRLHRRCDRRDPLGAADRARRPLRERAAPLLRPVRPKPPPVVAGQQGASPPAGRPGWLDAARRRPRGRLADPSHRLRPERVLEPVAKGDRTAAAGGATSATRAGASGRELSSEAVGESVGDLAPSHARTCERGRYWNRAG